MGVFLKWLFRIIVVLFGIAIIACMLGYYLLSRSIPEYTRAEPIQFGDYHAEILRDHQAIPHIYGEKENDLYFALGFAHAQDRLWQMVSSRRVVQGRLSEIFGEQTLDIDKYYRSLDMWNLSDRAVKTLPSEDYARLQAYADGVNAYLQDVNENRRGSGSPEFLIFGREISPWTPTDSLAIMKLMASELTGAAESEVLRAKLSSILSKQDMRDIFYDINLPRNFDRLSKTYQITPNDAKPTEIASLFSPKKGVGFSGASNAFVVAPERTANQAAILASDPHLRLSAPSIWMLAHMHFKENDLEVFGGTIPGIPVVLVGTNQKLAWGLTSSYLDDQDLIILKTNPKNPKQYIENNKAVKLQQEPVDIYIDGFEQPVRFMKSMSAYGPILPANDPLGAHNITPEGHIVALQWTALVENDHSISSGFKLMHAKTVKEGIASLENMVAPSQVVSLADSNGDIAQVAAGRIPIRAMDNPSQGTMPSPNWLGQVGFIGYKPFSTNPRNIEPSDGILIHTNNKFTDGAYPDHFSFDWGDVYRRLRADELLKTRKYHTIASFSEAQNDRISTASRVLLPLIAREFWFRPDQSEKKSEILEKLANWNGEFDALQNEPLIYTAWIEELNLLIFNDELGPLYNELGRVDPLRIERIYRNVDGASRWCDIRPTTQVEICPEIAEAALDRALEKLATKYGPNIEEWRWGRAHKAVHKNRFLSDIPLLGSLTNIVQEQSGDGETLLRLAFPGGEDYNFNANHGAGLRMVVDFSNLEHSKIIISTGQSGHVLSPHYDDLSTLWSAGEYLLMNTQRKVIEGNLQGRIEFVPATADQ